MEESQELHKDEMGIVTFSPAAGILELRCLPGSANMTDSDFKSSMQRYAISTVEHRRGLPWWT